MNEKELYKLVEEVLEEMWPANGSGSGGAISIGAFRMYMKQKGVDVESLIVK